jgi:hypothetical protein
MIKRADLKGFIKSHGYHPTVANGKPGPWNATGVSKS